MSDLLSLMPELINKVQTHRNIINVVTKNLMFDKIYHNRRLRFKTRKQFRLLFLTTCPNSFFKEQQEKVRERTCQRSVPQELLLGPTYYIFCTKNTQKPEPNHLILVFSDLFKTNHHK